MKVLILAAGMGARLVKPHPKALTLLSNGRTIMQHQTRNLLRYVSIDDIFVVVGFKKELIMEAFPELTYIYNDYFDTTNTSKSLLKGLTKIRGHDVIQLNGDVVFDHRVLDKLISHNSSCLAVNTEKVGDEEIKYTTDSEGNIDHVSKHVDSPLGEALGINKFLSHDIPTIINGLDACDDMDYFERGIEIAIENDLILQPVDVSEHLCTEIDFPEDLEDVNRQLHRRSEA